MRSELRAEAFGNRDPDTGLLRPWKCEPTLKVLKIDIMGIPRTDVWPACVIREEHLIQERELHHLVYDRLARLTNLEILCLGYPDTLRFLECPKMSLESGLHRLSGLKMLKELDVSSVKTMIGVEEVQWMIEHWPRLRVIRGLDKNVAGWLWKNYLEFTVLD
jgi:hypothetical protein